MKRNIGSGIFALAALGVYVLYRNRNSVRSMLERQGIRLPHRQEIMDRVRSRANETIGQVKDQVEDLKDRPRENLKEVG